METINLTSRGIWVAAKAAYEARQLQAQRQRRAICSYPGKCAIGVAMTQEQAQSVPNDPLVQLITKGLVDIDGRGMDGIYTHDPKISACLALQQAHDNWMGRDYIDEKGLGEKAFVEALDKLGELVK